MHPQTSAMGGPAAKDVSAVRPIIPLQLDLVSLPRGSGAKTWAPLPFEQLRFTAGSHKARLSDVA